MKFSKGDKFSYFDILVNNNIKYHLQSTFNTKVEETYQSLQTYLINPDSFGKYIHVTDNSNIETFNLTNFKNTLLDYIIFSIGADIYIFKAEGFNTHPMCNVHLELILKLIDKEVILNLIRTQAISIRYSSSLKAMRRSCLSI